MAVAEKPNARLEEYSARDSEEYLEKLGTIREKYSEKKNVWYQQHSR